MLSSTRRQQPWLSSASSDPFFVHGPAYLRSSLSPPRPLNIRVHAGRSWPVPLDSSPASLTTTLLELAFRMEQQAIYGFLGELQIENYRARDEDVDMWILQLLEGPRDEGNLNDCLSGDLPPSPLLDANAHHRTGPRKSGPRGTRKRRTSPWNPTFFGRHVSREYTRRKNNSRWTAEEVERLVQGVDEIGVGRWTELEQNFFEGSIRTAVNLKDKWRNLVTAYEEGSKITTQLHLKPSLVERIRKLAAKQADY